jgi:hypothetical protein
MNLSDPLWNRAVSSGANPSNVSNDTNVTNPTDLSAEFWQNQTNALISSISTSGSHLWTFKSYWYITVPVTVGTIFVPLIAGLIFRSISRSVYEHRRYWRVLVAILVIAGVILMDFFLPFLPSLIIFGVCLGVLGLSFFIKSLLVKRHRTMWTGYAIIYVLSLIPSIFQHSILMPYLPLLYLLLVWSRDDIRSVYLLWHLWRTEPETDLESTEEVGEEPVRTRSLSLQRTRAVQVDRRTRSL